MLELCTVEHSTQGASGALFYLSNYVLKISGNPEPVTSCCVQWHPSTRQTLKQVLADVDIVAGAAPVNLLWTGWQADQGAMKMVVSIGTMEIFFRIVNAEWLIASYTLMVTSFFY